MRPEVTEYGRKAKEIIDAHEGKATQFLQRIISCPSVLGNENEALDLLADSFQRIGLEVTKVPILESIREDEDYSFIDRAVGEEIDYSKKYNLVAVLLKESITRTNSFQ